MRMRSHKINWLKKIVFALFLLLTVGVGPTACFPGRRPHHDGDRNHKGDPRWSQEGDRRGDEGRDRFGGREGEREGEHREGGDRR